ncbi:MAG TPA: hypothetical protein VGA77_00075 [Propylenella sp.]
MARTPPKNTRSEAEERFSRAQRTTETATGIIAAEREAILKKTARLRKLRLAKEAREGETVLDKKPAKKSKKPAKKATAKRGGAG